MVFVAEKDGKIVGILRGRKDKLQSLFVRGDVHRQGIGSKLVNKFEQECVKQGSEKIILMSTLYAIPFYQAIGYKKSTGIRKMHSFDGEGFKVPAHEKGPEVIGDKNAHTSGNSAGKIQMTCLNIYHRPKYTGSNLAIPLLSSNQECYV